MIEGGMAHWGGGYDPHDLRIYTYNANTFIWDEQGKTILSTLPNGQLSHYETAVEFEFKQPKRNMYQHVKCGGYTFCGDAIALTYATNPGFYTHTFCALCQTHPPLDQFIWMPDKCPMNEVRGVPGLDLTLPHHWDPKDAY